MNMVGLGVVAGILDIPEDAITVVVENSLKKRGQPVLDAGLAGVVAGRGLVNGAEVGRFHLGAGETGASRLNVSGNEASGMGAVRGGVRFVAAYPITPATEILEWLAPNRRRWAASWSRRRTNCRRST